MSRRFDRIIRRIWRLRLAVFASWVAVFGTSTTMAELSTVRLEALFEPAEVEVQAQATFVMRLYQAVSIDDPQWRPPRFRLAELRELGDARQSEAMLDGRRYRVTERRYAVFPFASGSLVASDAYVETGFFEVGRGAFVRHRIDAPTATLVVRPLPEFAGDRWLPAQSVKVDERWELPGGPGVAYRRTIRIDARGVDAARIVFPSVQGDGFIANLERVERKNQVEGNWSVGVAETVWRIVPRGAGPLFVPEWVLDWWDVSAQQAQQVVLPAQRFERFVQAQNVEPRPARESGLEQATGQDAGGQMRLILLVWIPGFCLGASWIGSRLWRANAGWRALRRACRRNDAGAAKDALRMLPWSIQSSGLAPATIARICVDPEMVDVLMDLDSACYGKSKEWMGNSLRQLFPRFRRLLRDGRVRIR